MIIDNYDNNQDEEEQEGENSFYHSYFLEFIQFNSVKCPTMIMNVHPKHDTDSND